MRFHGRSAMVREWNADDLAWAKWLKSGPITIHPKSGVAHTFRTGAEALAWLRACFPPADAAPLREFRTPNGTPYCSTRPMFPS